MDPDELRVRAETLRKLRASPESYLAEYSSKFGNVLNADDAATLFDEYSRIGRGTGCRASGRYLDS